MVYFEFKEHDGIIVKWNIELDVDKLKEIRKEAIENCSDIYHHEHKILITEEENKLANRYYRNKKVKVLEDDPEKCILTFDEYVYPRLIKLIDDLLDGDAHVVSEIISPVETNQNYYDESLKKLDEEISLIDNYNFDLKIRKLSQLRDLVAEAKANENKKNISKYYQLVRESLNLEFIDEIEYSEVYRVMNFFDMPCDEVIKTK